ncbi:MAG: zf-HC2 domain-containing protein, partial [candidate division Zixibacteria bacterium]|nr:zf-HC2 domain-containing protein [candidate division Zixibacteria bacterium]
MRCRKVRSFLSAYCRDELQSNRRRQVSEHLLACPACRRQETVCRDMNTTLQEMPTLKATDGFNQRLLQRVAQERFAETRTKAYQPKSAPLFLWRKLVPVMATACIALLAVIVTL